MHNLCQVSTCNLKSTLPTTLQQPNPTHTTSSRPHPSLPLQLLKDPNIQRHPLPQPNRPFRMVPQLPLPLAQPVPFVHRVGMHQHRKRAPPNRQPRHKRPELRRREQVHLKHGDRVRPHRPVPHPVDAQLGELAPDAFPELVGVGGFCVCLVSK